MATYKKITQDRLHALLEYNEESGDLLWRHRPESEFESTKVWKIWNKRWAGNKAGTDLVSKKSKTVYRIVKVDGCMVLAHMVVWCMAYGDWPEDTLDHIDQDGTNNRLNNLRELTHAGQLKNRPKRSDNTSGKTGVSWHKGIGKWVARIGGDVALGSFEELEDAIRARAEAEKLQGYTIRGEDDDTSDGLRSAAV